MKSMNNIDITGTQDYVNQFVSNMSYKVPQKQSESKLPQKQQESSQKTKNDRKTEEILLQKRQNAAKMYSASSRKIFNIAQGKAPVIKSIIEDSEQRAQSLLQEDFKIKEVKSAYSLHKRSLTNMRETPKNPAVLRKSGDYTARVNPTPALPTRRSDITGVVSLSKIVRPKTTLDRIEVKDEKKEYSQVQLKKNDLSTLQSQLHETQRNKPSMHTQSKSVAHCTINQEGRTILQPSSVYSEGRNILPALRSNKASSKFELCGRTSAPKFDYEKIVNSGSAKNAIPSSKIGVIQLKSFDKRSTDDLIRNQMKSLRSMQKFEPTHQSKLLLGEVSESKSKKELLESAYKATPKLNMSSRRTQNRTIDHDHNHGGMSSQDQKPPIEDI